jgi:hypothetical protein
MNHYGNAVAVASDGSSLVAGNAQSHPDYDDNVSLGFVCKYAATGVLQWTRFVSNAEPKAISVDSADSVYVTGSFSGTAYFGTTNLVSSHSGPDWTERFLAKYDGAGDLLWAGAYGGDGHDYYYDDGESFGIAVPSPATSI